MDFITRFFARLFRPLFVHMSRWLSSSKRTRPTWQYEAFVVGFVLFGVAALTTPWGTMTEPAAWRGALINWISAAAVLVSFLQAQVGFRLAEAQSATASPSVLCHKWSGAYWLGKEILWFLVFFLSGAFAAIAGNIVFILYPAWRTVHTAERTKIRG
jgi:hypothetical protein